jgi:hypothetical protein
MTDKRPTVGKIASELLAKTPDSIDPIEVEQTLHDNYEVNLLECFNNAKKDMQGDFFIVVITKKEPLMQNVLRNYFFARRSCPTPDYDQTVYHYKSEHDFLDFVWVIPSKHACLTLMDHKIDLVPEQWGLLEFVLQFADGTLYRKAKKLNNEAIDSSLIIQ